MSVADIVDMQQTELRAEDCHVSPEFPEFQKVVEVTCLDTS